MKWKHTSELKHGSDFSGCLASSEVLTLKPMQDINFLFDKRHWFGGLFCLHSVRGITSVSVSATFFTLKALWNISVPWEGFKWLTYVDLRGYLLSNHFRFGLNSVFVDYDSTKQKKFVAVDNSEGGKKVS